MLYPQTILQNRYRIVRQLCKGGMGAVYEAVDHSHSRYAGVCEAQGFQDVRSQPGENHLVLLSVRMIR
jgi:hypothetical protein